MHKILFLFLCLSSTLYAEILELAQFKGVHNHLAPDTLIVLDIDDTLLVPVQMLGCDEWFQSRWKSYQQAGLSVSEGLEKTLAEWEAVRHVSQMEIVEPGTEGIVNHLQQQGYAVIGLTTQGLALATRTKMQLQEHQIDLSKTAISHEDHYFSVDGQGNLFRSGILFTAGSHKGKALFGLLDKLGYTPKRILFVNDKHSHLVPIEEIAQEKGVAFVGLRYAYSDARKKAYSDTIAHYQFTHSTFTHLVSDAEAKQQLKLE